MLAQLEKVKGVEKAYANRNGLLFRISVSPAADLEIVVLEVRKVLSDSARKPVRVTGDEFIRALDKEEWRDVERIGVMSAIEHRTLGLRAVTAFAKEERLDKEITDRLVKMAEEEWDRLARENAAEDSKHRGKRDWPSRYGQFDLALTNRAKALLTTEQLDRLKQALSDPSSTLPNGQKLQSFP